MKQDSTTAAWQLYEAGKEYKRRIGLYETVRRNEKFYRGDQWSGADDGLPHPVFNIVRRIVDFLIGAVAPKELTVHYTDDRLPFLDNSALRDSVNAGLELLNKNASYRFTHGRIDELSGRALLDAALTVGGTTPAAAGNRSAGTSAPTLCATRATFPPTRRLTMCRVRTGSFLRGARRLLPYAVRRRKPA